MCILDLAIGIYKRQMIYKTVVLNKVYPVHYGDFFLYFITSSLPSYHLYRDKNLIKHCVDR